MKRVIEFFVCTEALIAIGMIGVIGVMVACSPERESTVDRNEAKMYARWADGTKTAVTLYTLDLDGREHLKMVYGNESDSVRGDVVWEKPYELKDAPVSDDPVPGDLGE